MTPMLAFILGVDAGVIICNLTGWLSRRPRKSTDEQPARQQISMAHTVDEVAG